MVTHFGQSLNSQALSGHIIEQSGLSHLTSQTAFFGSWQELWQEGGSQIGSQIASHFGSSHFHEHSGWHFWAMAREIPRTITNKARFFITINKLL